MAVGAAHGVRRIVKRPRALARDAAGLPVVVFIEATNPPVMIDRNVEMNLVTTGAELRGLVAHEGLQENPAVRFRIQLDQEIMQRAHESVLAGCEFVQLGIFKIKIALAHGAFYVGNRVAHHAAKSSLSFGAMHDLLDRGVHQATVENGWIVTSAAPFRRLGANPALHVLDALAVPLIVERRKVVSRAGPLLVNVGVAALARVGLHEKLAGNFLLAVNLGGAGEKVALRAVAFVVHGFGRVGRILDDCVILPASVARVPGRDGESGKQEKADGVSTSGLHKARRQPALAPRPVRKKNRRAGHRQSNVQIDPVPLGTRGTGLDQNEAQNRGGKNEQPSKTGESRSVPQHAKQEYRQVDGRHDTNQGVQQNYARVEDVGLRKCVEINCGNKQKHQHARQSAISQNTLEEGGHRLVLGQPAHTGTLAVLDEYLRVFSSLAE